MVVTLQQILRPLFFMGFIMGLGFFPRKRLKFRWTIHLYILYSFTIWSVYAYLFIYIMTYLPQQVLFDSIAMEICEKSNFLFAITSVIMSFYHQKRFDINIKKLATVDDTLERLGTPKMYEKLHIKIKQIIIGWILYSLMTNFFDTIWWLGFEEITSWGLYMALIINYCVHINVFMEILFIFFIWYIGTRFDKVNEHMRYLLMREDHGLRCKWRKSGIIRHRYVLCTDYKQTLWTSMHLHLELSRLARELNLIFTVQITVEMLSYFLHLTSLLHYLYWMLIHAQREEIFKIDDWFNIILWIFIYFVRLYIINYFCENVTIKANEIGKLFHQLTYIHQYADIREEIYQFTLQTMHNPLKFTGMGLFYLGHEFFRKFCMAIVMYVIVLVQFKLLILY